MALITFEDKDNISAEGTPERTWRAEDANEVKSVVNQNAQSSITMTTWSFPAGALPTSANVIYIATADYNTVGDPAGYIPAGAWFIATTTPSSFSDFYVKI